jgi:hypothetical protein
LLGLSLDRDSASFHSSIGELLARNPRVDEVAAENQLSSFPDDPFIFPSIGAPYVSSLSDWKSGSIQDEIRTVLGLHPDVYATHNFYTFVDGEVRSDSELTAQREFASHAGLPITVPWNTTIEIENGTDQLDPLFASRDWRFPNGDPLTDPRDIVAETYSGGLHRMDFGAVPSAFAPSSPDLLYIGSEKKLSEGFAGIFVDGPITKAFNGIDFSVWAVDAFRDRLASMSAERLSELGIDEPSGFDITSYLESNQLTPSSGNDPREDPVFQEYLLHHHLGIKEYMSTYREMLHESYPDRMANGDIAVFSNQFLGSLTNPQAPNIYLSDHVDMIYSEHLPLVQPPNDYKYKIEQALGRFSKPAISKGYIDVDKTDEDFEFDELYPMFQRFRTAEAYAHGVRHRLPLASRTPDKALSQWLASDGTVPDQLKSFIDFLWGHERFLTDVDPDNPVAVVWSLPDRLFRRLPQWDIEEPPSGIESFLGTVKRLRETQYPYDVLAFGHPRLWDDTEQLERLSEYEAVVLPQIEAITDAQLSAIRTYLDEGGVVISSGEPPTRTGMWNDRGSPAVFEHPNVTTLGENPARRRERAGRAGGSLVDSLAENGIRPYTTRDDPNVTITRSTKRDAPVTIVHLLNHEYDRSTDSFDVKEEVGVRFPAPEHDVQVARYHSPQGMSDVDVREEDGTFHITVPSCVEWGFVTLAPSEAALVDGGVKSEANSKVETARNRVNEAQERGKDWSSSFAVAEAKMESAETALEFDAYRNAKRTAEEAISAVEKTSRRPVVAIDQSHGQTFRFSEDEGAIPNIPEHFEFPEYTVIRSWEEGVLEDVDVLLIPPAYQFRGNSYDFSYRSVTEIESFVADGGGLAVFARGGVDSGIDDLTLEFDFLFNKSSIVFPEGHPQTAETTDTDHPLIQGVPELEAAWSTPIQSMPDTATELTTLPETTEAWIHNQAPLNEKSDDENSASNATIYATAPHGEGRVAMLGNVRYAIAPDHAAHFEPVMRNLLSYLHREESAEQTPTPTASPTPTETSASSPTETSTPGNAVTESPTTGSGNGFGIVPALTALGAGALLRRRWDRDNSE